MIKLESGVWRTDHTSRVMAGVSVGRRSGRLKAVLLHARGEGWDLTLDGAEVLTAPPSAGSSRKLGSAMADILLELAKRAEVPLPNIDVVGVHQIPPGSDGSDVATELAHRTGLTVVWGVEDCLRQVGGVGPLSVVADWLTFRHRRLHRLLLDIGPTLRLTDLPPGRGCVAVSCFDVGPGCDFLDRLTHELSHGRLPYDPSGHFAVQGTLSDPLLSQWLSHPFLLQVPPRFLEADAFDESFYQSSFTLARELSLSARDVLCTANQYLAQNFRDALRRFLPPRFQPDEVVVRGGGSWNGFLWKLMQDALPEARWIRSDELGLPTEAHQAMIGCLMGYAVLEGLGALPWPFRWGNGQWRLQGHLTPGSAEHWARWVCHLADSLEWADQRAA